MTTCQFVGDFNIEVSYSLVRWSGHFGRVGLFAGDPSVERIESSSGDQVALSPGPGVQVIGATLISGSAGQMELARKGTTYTASSWSSSTGQWVRLAGVDGNLGPDSVVLKVWADSPDTDYTAAFHDFRIISGSCTKTA